MKAAESKYQLFFILPTIFVFRSLTTYNDRIPGPLSLIKNTTFSLKTPKISCIFHIIWVKISIIPINKTPTISTIPSKRCPSIQSIIYEEIGFSQLFPLRSLLKWRHIQSSQFEQIHYLLHLYYRIVPYKLQEMMRKENRGSYKKTLQLPFE